MRVGDDLSVRMSGDAAQLLNALQKVTVRLDQNAKAFKEVVNEAKQMKKAGQEAAETQEAGFGANALNSIRSMATGYLSVNAALQLINTALREKQELERKSAQAQITLANARKEMIRNLPGGNAGDVNKSMAISGAISRETGVEERFISAAMAQALSSGGSLQQSERAVRQAARFLPDQPESVGEFAGSLIQLAGVTGSSDARVNQGLLSFVGALSPIVSPSLQAKNVPPALIGSLSFGTKGADAAALFGAISTGAADKLGATSGTGLVKLSQQLQEFMPARLTSAQQRDIAAAKEKQTSGQELNDLELKALALEKRSAMGLTDTGARIKALQANRDLADEFLAAASFEATVLGPITDLVSDANSPTAKLFAKNQTLLPDNAGLAKIGDQTIKNYALDPLEQNARLQRTFTQSEADMLANNLDAGITGTTRENIGGLLHAGGADFARRMLNKIEFLSEVDAGDSEALSLAIEQTTRERDYLQFGRPTRPGFPAPEAAYVVQQDRQLSPTESKQLEALDSVLDVLKEIRDTNKGLRDDAARRQAPAPVNAHAE